MFLADMENFVNIKLNSNPKKTAFFDSLSTSLPKANRPKTGLGEVAVHVGMD